jgi:hypothetical protein
MSCQKIVEILKVKTLSIRISLLNIVLKNQNKIFVIKIRGVLFFQTSDDDENSWSETSY